IMRTRRGAVNLRPKERPPRARSGRGTVPIGVGAPILTEARPRRRRATSREQFEAAVTGCVVTALLAAAISLGPATSATSTPPRPPQQARATPAPSTGRTSPAPSVPTDGTVSLRAAITAINAGTDLDDTDTSTQSPGTFGTNETINFSIAGTGVQTISPTSAL